MGQADTVANSGRILHAAQSHSEVVLGGGRVPAYFKGTDVAMLAAGVSEITSEYGQTKGLPHRITERKLEAIAKVLIFVFGALLFLLGLLLSLSLGGCYTEAGGVSTGH